MKMLNITGFAAIAFLAMMMDFLRAGPDQKAGVTPELQYTSDNRLIRPQGYREWIFISSGLGMSYTSAAEGGDTSPVFTNVFVEPSAYRQYLATGRWPDNTIFVLEEYSSASHGSINKQGRYQDAFIGVEAEVKDESRFAEKWAYFGFGINGKSATAFPKSACWSCHNQNGAVENTFAQFYPTLRDVARAKGTFKAKMSN